MTLRTDYWQRSAVIMGLVVLWCALQSNALLAQQFTWLGDKNNKYTTHKDPAGRFELEYPAKDWRLLPTVGASLAVFSRNDGTTFFIDQTRLKEQLTPAEVESMADIEVGRLKEQYPKVTEFTSQMLDGRSGRGVLVRFARPATEMEIVVQYSVPVGQTLYRLNGVMPAKLAPKHEAIVMHMIQSFKAGGDASSRQH